MRLGIHQALGILVSFYVWASLARSLHETNNFLPKERYFDNGDEFIHSALEPRNSSGLIIRAVDVDMPDDSPPGIACRTLCSATTNPVKRDWRDLNPRSALEKRFDDEWPPLAGTDKAKDTYMRDTCDALTNDQSIVPGWANKPPGFASAVTAPLGNTKLRFGTREICGCTMLFVVSRKRVYLAHYWEAESFGKLPGRNYQLQFETQVTNFLTSGYQAPVDGAPAQDSLQQHAADFQGDVNLHAYILTPARGNTANNNPLYPAKIRLMASTVANILGITPDQVSQNTYVAVDGSIDKNILKNTAAGRMLFDYDPTGGPLGTRRKPYAAWRIIWQKEQILADQWPAT